MRNRIKENSNRGGALLSVIIAMTVVGILGALVLANSFTNFQMKQINKKSKDNFYSAESILDEIFVGLQEEVSKQYKAAYTNIMENYGNYSTVEEMKADFDTQFVLSMVDALKEDPSKPDYYSLQKIKDYVTYANYPTEDAYTVASVVLSNTTDASGNVINTYDNRLETLTDGVCIRNVVVTYTHKGYFNKITTDIKVNTPALEFARISTIPDIIDYCLVAQDGITVQASNRLDLVGKVFAGIDEADTEKAGIRLYNGSKLIANDPASTLLINEGDFFAEGDAEFRIAGSTSFWTKGITASGGKNILDLQGRIYVTDDTTLNGSGNQLTLANQYYGYSGSDTAAGDSSAIIINGANTVLDMSKLESLVVAGTAFVSTKDYAIPGKTGANVLMGDSVAVKGNQIAYLLPTECDGIVTNPMTYEQYEELIKTANWQQKALNTTLSTLQKSINSYGSVSIQPVFRTDRAHGTVTGHVYLYISFSDADVASKYFMDYYKTGGKESLEDYLDAYVPNFNFDTADTSRVVTEGNYLVPRAEQKASYAGKKGNVADVTQELGNYVNTYEALCAKLVENKSTLTTEELNRDVYENLIATAKLNEFFDACKTNASGTKSNNVTYSNTDNIEVATIWANETDKNNGTGVRCVVVDNDDATDSAYTVPTGGKGILIATGDVKIPASGAVDTWQGLIVCNGGATVISSGSLKADAGSVTQALQYLCSIGAAEVSETTPDCNYAVMNFFVGGGNYTVGESSEAEGARVDVRECLSYENWKSE